MVTTSFLPIAHHHLPPGKLPCPALLLTLSLSLSSVLATFLFLKSRSLFSGVVVGPSLACCSIQFTQFLQFMQSIHSFIHSSVRFERRCFDGRLFRRESQITASTYNTSFFRPPSTSCPDALHLLVLHRHCKNVRGRRPLRPAALRRGSFLLASNRSCNWLIVFIIYSNGWSGRC